MIYINKNDDAIEFYDKNRKSHRLNGPAFIEGEYQSWYQNGMFHRIGGPSVISSYGIFWCLQGVKYTETEYHHKIKEMGL